MLSNLQVLNNFCPHSSYKRQFLSVSWQTVGNGQVWDAARANISLAKSCELNWISRISWRVQSFPCPDAFKEGTQFIPRQIAAPFLRGGFLLSFLPQVIIKAAAAAEAN